MRIAVYCMLYAIFVREIDGLTISDCIDLRVPFSGHHLSAERAPHT